MSAATTTRTKRATIKAQQTVAKAASIIEQATSPVEAAIGLRDHILALLYPVAEMTENTGSFCGQLATAAHDTLLQSSFDDDARDAVYLAEAMVHGAMHATDAELGQIATLDVAAECVAKLSTLVDEHNGFASDKPAAPHSAAPDDKPKQVDPELAEFLRTIEREACIEVHELAGALRDMLENGDAASERFYAMRGMLSRLQDLSNIMFTARNEDGDATAGDANRVAVELGVAFFKPATAGLAALRPAA